MVPNTAVTFILASVTMWMLWREKRFRRTYALTWFCAVAVILIGSLTLAEYLTGANLGFDSWLFQEKLQVAATSFPGRPSPHTALSFLIIGVALLLIRTQKTRAYNLAQVFALFVLTVAAAEAAIGLAILVVYFRNRGTIAVEDINLMKG